MFYIGLLIKFVYEVWKKKKMKISFLNILPINLLWKYILTKYCIVNYLWNSNNHKIPILCSQIIAVL